MGEFGDTLNVLSSTAEALKHSSDVSTRLHRNNAELILLIDPDKESLGIIVEDSSARWPVSVQSTGFKEPVSFLEKEVVSDELLLVSFAHSSKRVELSGKVTLELTTCLNNLLFYLISLILRDSRSKWNTIQVSSNPDSSALDLGCVCCCEWWAVKFGVVHIAGMDISLLVTVILFNDWIKERSKCGVRVMTTGINTDTRVNILASGKNSLFE